MVGRSTFDFEGDVAIVTGATKGIGREIAASLVASGADVTINARTPEDVDRVANELDSAGGGDVIGVAGDVSEPADVEDLIETTIDTFGRIDLLVNNAAVWPPGPMPDVGLDAFDFGIGVNVRGAFYAATLAARRMIEMDIEGNVVNITSQAGDRHGEDHGLYGVSKSAQNGLTWRMAHQLAGHGIRVNAVSTVQTDSYQLRKGYVEDKTPEELTDAEIVRAKAERGEEIPLGRVGEPEDIADGVCFLASDAASYVTGHILRVSGGKDLE